MGKRSRPFSYPPSGKTVQEDTPENGYNPTNKIICLTKGRHRSQTASVWFQPLSDLKQPEAVLSQPQKAEYKLCLLALSADVLPDTWLKAFLRAENKFQDSNDSYNNDATC